MCKQNKLDFVGVINDFMGNEKIAFFMYFRVKLSY